MKDTYANFRHVDDAGLSDSGAGSLVPQARPAILHWVSSQIVHLEPELRHWLMRSCRDPSDVDDLVQDIYFRLLRLPSTQHIHDPRAYLFQMARNMLINRLKRSSVVNIETVQNLDDLGASDTMPSPERIAVARAELKWVLGLIAGLPDRCRQVFELRKIYGLSQSETAKRLRLSENVVEKETARGMVLISAKLGHAGETHGISYTKPLTANSERMPGTDL